MRSGTRIDSPVSWNSKRKREVRTFEVDKANYIRDNMTIASINMDFDGRDVDYGPYSLLTRKEC